MVHHRTMKDLLQAGLDRNPGTSLGAQLFTVFLHDLSKAFFWALPTFIPFPHPRYTESEPLRSMLRHFKNNAAA